MIEGARKTRGLSIYYSVTTAAICFNNNRFTFSSANAFEQNIYIFNQLHFRKQKDHASLHDPQIFVIVTVIYLTPPVFV